MASTLDTDRYRLLQAALGPAPILQLRRTRPDYLLALLQDLVAAQDATAVQVLDEVNGLASLSGSIVMPITEPAGDIAAMLKDRRHGLNDDFDAKPSVIHLRLPEARLSEPAVEAALSAWAHAVHTSGSSWRLLLVADVDPSPSVTDWVEHVEFSPPRGTELTAFVRELMQDALLTPPADRTVADAAKVVQGLGGADVGEVIARAAAHAATRSMLGLAEEAVEDRRVEWLLEQLAVERDRVLRRAAGLEVKARTIEPDQIGGLTYLKRYLAVQAHILAQRGVARGVPLPRGVLLVGLPGCGKSLAAQAAAAIMDMPLLRLDVGSLMGRWLGESERNLRDALDSAEAAAPCVLWVDELEKALGSLNNDDGGGTGKRMLGRLLTWMQENDSGVYLFATANQVKDLPPELLRRGRFDELFMVGLPKESEREEIVRIHLARWNSSLKDGELKTAVERTDRFTGADIEALIKEARQRSWVGGEELSLKHIQEVLKVFRPLSEQWGDRISIMERELQEQGFRDASEDSEGSLPPIPKRDAHADLLPPALERIWAGTGRLVLHIGKEPPFTLQIDGPPRARTARMAEQRRAEIGPDEPAAVGALRVEEGVLRLVLATGSPPIGEAAGLPALGPNRKSLRLEVDDRGLVVCFRDQSGRDQRAVPDRFDVKPAGAGLLPPELVGVLRGEQPVRFKNDFGECYLTVDAGRGDSPVRGLPSAGLKLTGTRTYARMVVAVEGSRLLFLPFVLTPRSDQIRGTGPRACDLDRFGWGQAVRVRDGKTVVTPIGEHEVQILLERLGCPQPSASAPIDPRQEQAVNSKAALTFRVILSQHPYLAEIRGKAGGNNYDARLLDQAGRTTSASTGVARKTNKTRWDFKFPKADRVELREFTIKQLGDGWIGKAGLVEIRVKAVR